jgi:acylphosphatase
MSTQAHIFFSGSVQGVGFRYTTHRMAIQIGLKGYVKNLPDGRVEIKVQGTKDQIQSLVLSLKNHFGGYIVNCDTTFEDKASSSFKEFTIEF